MSKSILTDAGFWIAFFDTSDEENHEISVILMEEIRKFQILFPWPIMYEVLRTKFVKNKFWCENLKTSLKSLNVTYLNDEQYREEALTQTLELASIGKRSISLVDMIVRLMLMDIDIKIDYITTFNIKDFYDVCKRRRVTILNDSL